MRVFRRRHRDRANAFKNVFTVLIWGCFETVFNDIGAQLVKAKAHDVIHDTVENLYLLFILTFLKDMCDHVIAILLRSKFISSFDNLINDCENLVAGELL